MAEFGSRVGATFQRSAAEHLVQGDQIVQFRQVNGNQRLLCGIERALRVKHHQEAIDTVAKQGVCKPVAICCRLDWTT